MKCSTRCAALAAISAVVVSSAVASSEVDGGGSTGTTAREIRIHSHNDYAQKRPFWGAYEVGADSIEADVFLVDGELLVAHSRKGLKKVNTLSRELGLDYINTDHLSAVAAFLRAKDKGTCS